MKSSILLSLISSLLLSLASCDNKPASGADEGKLQPITHAGPTDEDRAVYAAACNEVLLKLKTPGTAQFGPIEKAVLEHRPDNTWHIYGDVDAQNLDGALVRNQWTVFMEYDASRNQAVNVTQSLVY